jgi:hypothetical protein
VRYIKESENLAKLSWLPLCAAAAPGAAAAASASIGIAAAAAGAVVVAVLDPRQVDV